MPWLRQAAAGAAAGLLAVLVAVVAVRHGAPFAVDASVHRWALAHRSAGWTGLARGVTFTGTGLPPYALAALAGALASLSLGDRSRWWRGAIVGVLALALGQTVRITLATALARPRPPRGDWATAASGASLPSGHSTTSALVAIGLAAALCVGCRRWWTRLLACAVPGVWAVGVGVSRVYLGVHWPTDVLAGWLLATALSCALMPRLVAAVLRPARRADASSGLAPTGGGEGGGAEQDQPQGDQRRPRGDQGQ
ncbi:phosphatase PAP2 family protein [Streptacidiphilus cavernicola]|uniref:Phosphatase PAP2 family protein n=1 Tax=Streptacidiphilus cavernicola TaxID=3342716 RepID=A0ABV6VNT2_9ACTN